ncbi:MAG TPA: NADP oxidoreductase [Gemmatimonadales bacterium]
MSGTPLRAAVIGSGPAGFYVADHLLSHPDPAVTVDLFERLPTPFGLVRYGVAPDHPKIKTVTRSFDKTAQHPGFRFFGNVHVGQDLRLADLRRHYHIVCFTTGAQTDRRMGIPGEDLARSHAATEFVGWYNGHPDYRDREFDLSVERVAIVGVGNVALDVARILCCTDEELTQTDIADHALDALRASRVREVVLLGRRGAAQAAFTNVEVRELGEMAGADVDVRSAELEGASGTAGVDDDRLLAKKVEILRELSTRERTGKPRLLSLRFLVSPVALTAGPDGKVGGVRLMRNALAQGADGGWRAEPTGQEETLPAQLVFRSVGYHGVPLADVPFDTRRGIVPNDHGRVLEGAAPVPGLYVGGWIKRGPSGVIGTNKADAADTVAAIFADAAAGRLPAPAEPSPAAAEALVRERQPRVVTYDDWRTLDALEVAAGKPDGKPRRKMVTVGEMLGALAKP